MDPKFFSAMLTFIIMLTVFRVSVTMPVEEVQGKGIDGKSPLEYKTNTTSTLQANPAKGIDWTIFGLPGMVKSFRPIDMVKIMAGRVTHGVKDMPESYWFNKTITAGTKILRKFEQWKHRYPNTLGVPLGLVLRFF